MPGNGTPGLEYIGGAMKHALPSPCSCPECGGEFAVVARTAGGFGTTQATDLLEWRCSACGHEEKESRAQADGEDGDWPASKFART